MFVGDDSDGFIAKGVATDAVGVGVGVDDRLDSAGDSNTVGAVLDDFNAGVGEGVVGVDCAGYCDGVNCVSVLVIIVDYVVDDADYVDDDDDLVLVILAVMKMLVLVLIV